MASRRRWRLVASVSCRGMSADVQLSHARYQKGTHTTPVHARILALRDHGLYVLRIHLINPSKELKMRSLMKNLTCRFLIVALLSLSFHHAHELAGISMAYRADVVAAAGIRYPQGLANALAKCAAQVPASDSYFASDRFNATRWVWFNVYADHASPMAGDLDDALVRSAALAEW